MMIAVQAVEKHTGQLRQEHAWLRERVDAFQAENAELKVRLERLQRTLTTTR